MFPLKDIVLFRITSQKTLEKKINSDLQKDIKRNTIIFLANIKMSLPITSNEIRNLLRDIHPDMNISENSIEFLQTIFAPLINILTSLPTPLDRKNYIK